MKHTFTANERIKGGKVAAAKEGGNCPRCGMHFDSHAALAGHLGLHGFADRFADGDIKKGRLLFAITGAAASDPFPENGAYADGHQVLSICKQNYEQSNHHRAP